MGDFMNAALLVVVAEMGDKTQLLAMAMASKYKVRQVMLGVLVATVLNHALAVAVGSWISTIVPMDIIKMIAGAAFLVFGFWTLRGDKLDEEDSPKKKFGPIVTVAIAFFLAEMGDKTQLMTITIAANCTNPFFILMGTTTGMLIADGIGIICGAWMGKHVPDRYIKWGAGLIFLFFGTLTIYQSVPGWLITPINLVVYVLVVGVLSYLIGIKYSYNEQVDQNSAKNEE